MRLIYIYGPPAVGKLTVARELGLLTGIPVFDNHLSFDCVRPVYGIDSPKLNPLVEKIRHLVISEAARDGISLIFTFVYGHPHDIDYVARICDLVEGHGGSVDFVQLTCDAAAQEQRVVAAHRLGRKLDSVDNLRAWSATRDLTRAIPGRGGLCIDTTSLPAADAALQIAVALGVALI